MAQAKGKRANNETLSLRIDSRLRYKLNLIATLDDRTVTSVIERMTELFMEEVTARDIPVWLPDFPSIDEWMHDRKINYAKIEALLWSDDEAIRSMRFFLSFPHKLQASDRILSDFLFSGRFQGKDRLWSDRELQGAFIREKPKGGSVFYTTVDLSKVHNNWERMKNAADEAKESGLFKPMYDLDLQD